jgi:DNA-binding MarR family transcriptional regulator
MDDAPAPEVDVAALMDTTRVMTAIVAHSLADLDEPVTVPQLRVLVMIQGRGPLNLSAVAEGLGVNASNASRTCDRLVSGGLLDRRRAEEDRRSVVLSLTAEGERVVDALMRQRQGMLEQIVARMPAREQQRLAKSLEAFLQAAATVGEDGGLTDEDGHLVRRLV